MEHEMRKTILVVEDEAIIREMLLEFLQEEGFEVHCAADGQEGLAVFAQVSPQVLITDLAMPKMGGVDMLRALKPAIELDHAAIVLTGRGTDEDVENCFALGVQMFLRKPVNLGELRGVVMRCLKMMHYGEKLKAEMVEKQLVLQRLQEQHALLESTFDLIVEGAVLLDEGFLVRMISRKGRAILGIQEDMDDRKPAVALMGAEIAGPGGILAHCASSGTCAEGLETRILCASGEVIPAIISVTPVQIDGACNGWLLVFRSRRDEERGHRDRSGPARFGCMVGRDPAMKKIFALIDKVATSGASVLIRGESGTGKELVARELHERSLRAQKSFHAVSCAAISTELLESEFFGHERGAFTGAHTAKQGRFELADGGTLFLDEVAEIPLSLQGKLLRALQERRFERVGGTRTINVDFRLVAATNHDLKEMIETGRFREDLYYRLNVVPITLPPLRDRPGDILLLAEAFIEELSSLEQRTARQLTPAAVQALVDYHWPGNVRELYNAIEYAFALSEHDLLEIANLPDSLGHAYLSPNKRPAHSEKEQIMCALEQTGFNQGRAAALLGVNRSTLYRKRKKYKI